MNESPSSEQWQEWLEVQQEHQCEIRYSRVTTVKWETQFPFWHTFTRQVRSGQILLSHGGKLICSQVLRNTLIVLIYWSIYVPALTYGHELCVMTERIRSRIQVADMSFLHRVAGRSLSPHREEPAEVARASVPDAPWTPSREMFLPCPAKRRPWGRPRTRWSDYVARLAWERLGILLEELEEVSREREVWVSLLRQLPPRPGPG